MALHRIQYFLALSLCCLLVACGDEETKKSHSPIAGDGSAEPVPGAAPPSIDPFVADPASEGSQPSEAAASGGTSSSPEPVDQQYQRTLQEMEQVQLSFNKDQHLESAQLDRLFALYQSSIKGLDLQAPKRAILEPALKNLDTLLARISAENTQLKIFYDLAYSYLESIEAGTSADIPEVVKTLPFRITATELRTQSNAELSARLLLQKEKLQELLSRSF